MLKGAPMTRGNKYTYAIFIDIDIIYSEWGARNIFSSLEGGFAKNNLEALSYCILKR